MGMLARTGKEAEIIALKYKALYALALTRREIIIICGVASRNAVDQTAMQSE